jgi:hypothetical protein
MENMNLEQRAIIQKIMKQAGGAGNDSHNINWINLDLSVKNKDIIVDEGSIYIAIKTANEINNDPNPFNQTMANILNSSKFKELFYLIQYYIVLSNTDLQAAIGDHNANINSLKFCIKTAYGLSENFLQLSLFKHHIENSPLKIMNISWNTIDAPLLNECYKKTIEDFQNNVFENIKDVIFEKVEDPTTPNKLKFTPVFKIKLDSTKMQEILKQEAIEEANKIINNKTKKKYIKIEIAGETIKKIYKQDKKVSFLLKDSLNVIVVFFLMSFAVVVCSNLQMDKIKIKLIKLKKDKLSNIF